MDLMVNSAAFWSAVAAIFAAFTSFLMLLIQRNSRLEEARPELILDGWSRMEHCTGDAKHEFVIFQTIRNVGRGPAINLTLNSHSSKNNCRIACMTTTRLAILPQNESHDIKGEICLWWQNVAEENSMKHLSIEIEILFWDLRNMQCKTKYTIFLTEPPSILYCSNKLADGIYLSDRTTVIRPVWLLKIFSFLQSFSLKELWKKFKTKL